jgi:hypothetical protein
MKDDSKNSAEFVCKCGKMKGWITENELHPNACPNCKRRYMGVYNPQKLTIEAIEIGKDAEYHPSEKEQEEVRKQYLRYQWKRKWIPFYKMYNNRKSNKQLLSATKQNNSKDK